MNWSKCSLYDLNLHLYFQSGTYKLATIKIQKPYIVLLLIVHMTNGEKVAGLISTDSEHRVGVPPMVKVKDIIKLQGLA